MQKDDLLTHIASAGYNVGFGAKKTFATFDIVSKIPGWIGIISLAVSILGLYMDEMSSKHIAAIFIILSIGSLYINFYDGDKSKYEEAGKKQTTIFRKIERLYYDAKSENEPDSVKYIEQLNNLMNDFDETTITKQICGSNWYAHYKFFSEMEKRWIEDQLSLTFWKDKLPNTLKLFVFVIFCVAVFLMTYRYI
ncbi:TPA: SLATT domain-containing protein [Proteus mirabilis]|uniref:SLATT domain-containing protein n=1 Tax=Proteus mirabilis TaxID=584 RepID=UPI001A2D1C09|nr:SLATT domain-containing protein [Proteus mirabilis]MBI6377837.1 SLATT domain-containing protein [Proteus mirabilis]MCU9580822.1 SLATT domain-containing protein [Proteus mirabilis]HBC5065869.1 SLATT domain-containing protein [Proteus mirabilis]